MATIVQQDLSEAQEATKKAIQEIDNLKTRATQSRREWDAKADAYEEKLRKQNSDNNKALFEKTLEIRQRKEETDRLQRDLHISRKEVEHQKKLRETELKRVKDSWDIERKSFEERCRNLEANLNHAIEEQKDTLKEQNATLQKQDLKIQTLENANSNLEADVWELRAVKSSNDALQTANRDLHAQIMALESDKRKLLSEKSVSDEQIKQQFDSTSKELSRVKDELFTAVSAGDDYQRKLSNRSLALEREGERLRQAQIDYNEVSEKLESVTAALTIETEEKRHLQASLDETKQAMEETKAAAEERCTELVNEVAALKLSNKQAQDAISTKLKGDHEQYKLNVTKQADDSMNQLVQTQQDGKRDRERLEAQLAECQAQLQAVYDQMDLQKRLSKESLQKLVQDNLSARQDLVKENEKKVANSRKAYNDLEKKLAAQTLEAHTATVMKEIHLEKRRAAEYGRDGLRKTVQKLREELKERGTLIASYERSNVQSEEFADTNSILTQQLHELQAQLDGLNSRLETITEERDQLSRLNKEASDWQTLYQMAINRIKEETQKLAPVLEDSESFSLAGQHQVRGVDPIDPYALRNKFTPKYPYYLGDKLGATYAAGGPFDENYEGLLPAEAQSLGDPAYLYDICGDSLSHVKQELREWQTERSAKSDKLQGLVQMAKSMAK
jgi:hypothetical protein